MTRFLAKRALSFIFCVIGITLVVFIATHCLPADPARAAAGPSASREQVEEKRVELGLDRPLYVQYADYMKGLLRLDMGISYKSKQPIMAEISKRIAATMELTILSLISYFILSLLMGSIAAIRRNKIVDHVIRIFSVGSMAVPSYWLALLLQYFLYYKAQLFPAGFRLPVGVAGPDKITGLYLLDSALQGEWMLFAMSARHLFLPVVSLIIGYCGITTRMMRTQLLQELRQDYIRTARSKGLKEHTVIKRHAFKNAISPILTMVGMQAGGMMGGTVLIEKIFSWPGLGTYALEAIMSMDLLVIAGITVVMAVIFIFISLIVDISYVIIDPRVRL